MERKFPTLGELAKGYGFKLYGMKFLNRQTLNCTDYAITTLKDRHKLYSYHCHGPSERTHDHS